MADKATNLVKKAGSLPATSIGGEEGLVLNGELGRTTIQPHVVAKIAGLAVREVSGVRSLVPWNAGQQLSNIVSSVRGNSMRDLGVHVDVGQVEAAVDVRIITDYGVSIPRIAVAIRENVGRRIQEMTGLRLKEANIEVVDLWFEDETPEVEETGSRVQ